jgi:hypothetical protein
MLDAKCAVDSAKAGLKEGKEWVLKKTVQLPREVGKRFSDPIDWQLRF